jgi:hypothetical protein
MNKTYAYLNVLLLVLVTYLELFNLQTTTTTTRSERDTSEQQSCRSRLLLNHNDSFGRQRQKMGLLVYVKFMSHAASRGEARPYTR